MRSIHDLTTAEAYQLVTEHFGLTMPPQDAVENEDWGRDYVLQWLLAQGPDALKQLGLSSEPPCDQDAS